MSYVAFTENSMLQTDILGVIPPEFPWHPPPPTYQASMHEQRIQR